MAPMANLNSACSAGTALAPRAELAPEEMTVSELQNALAENDAALAKLAELLNLRQQHTRLIAMRGRILVAFANRKEQQK